MQWHLSKTHAKRKSCTTGGCTFAMCRKRNKCFDLCLIFYTGACQRLFRNDLHRKQAFVVRHLSWRTTNPLPCVGTGTRRKNKQLAPVAYDGRLRWWRECIRLAHDKYFSEKTGPMYRPIVSLMLNPSIKLRCAGYIRDLLTRTTFYNKHK
jgi:hypothetical protein